MSQAGTVSDQIRAVRLMGFHYIQENQRRLLNRLTYILLEGLVDLYAANALVQALLSAPASAAQYVAESIELLMQQKVEAPTGYTPTPSRGQKQIYNSEVRNCLERAEDLERRNAELEGTVRELTEKVGRQGKVISKITYKYNSVTDLLFEIKEKHQRQMQDTIEKYGEELDCLGKKNEELRENEIRARVQLELMERRRGLCSAQREENEQQTFVSEAKSVSEGSHGQRLAICSADAFTYAPEESCPSFVPQVISWQVHPTAKNLIFDKLVNISIAPAHRLDQTCNSSQTCTQCAEQGGQTELTGQQIDSFGSQRAQFLQEVSVLTLLDQQSQKQSQSAREKLETRQKEYQGLMRCYNSLHDGFERLRREASRQSEEHGSAVACLAAQVQRLSLQNREMEQRILEFPSNSRASAASKSEEEVRSSCGQSEESTTPRKRENSLPLSQISQFDCEAYIRKETIGKYLLQLLDKNCRGEEAAIVVDQISSCLDWKEEQVQRLRHYSRRSRLKEEAKGGTGKEGKGGEGKEEAVSPEGFEARLLRFLRDE